LIVFGDASGVVALSVLAEVGRSINAGGLLSVSLAHTTLVVVTRDTVQQDAVLTALSCILSGITELTGFNKSITTDTLARYARSA